MLFVIASIVLLILLCISIMNYSYQSNNYRGLPDEARKKLSIFNSPGAWIIYTLIISILLVIVIVGAFYSLVGGIGSMNSNTQ